MKRTSALLLALLALPSSLFTQTLQWAPSPAGPWEQVDTPLSMESNGTLIYSAPTKEPLGFFRLLMEDGQLGDILRFEPTITLTFTPPKPKIDTTNPMYVATTVVIPAQFLKHGRMTELRYEKCSLANGLLKHAGGRVYTLPGPEHDVWRWTDQQGRNPPRCIGTRVKFADGTMYDGWVRDYATTTTYPMPILTVQTAGGNAFWVRIQ